MEDITMNEAELTILSLLSEAPRYGHELQTIIETRGLRDWVAIGISSVYYLLNKLEKQALITSSLAPNATGTDRRYYTLTPAGHGVLQTAIADLLRQPHAFGTGFELGLANISVLKPAQVYQVLQHHYADLSARYETIQKAWEYHQTENTMLSDALRALYTHSIAMMGAEVDWLRQFLDDWATRYPGVDQRSADQHNPHKAATRLSPRPTPDAAKLIQKLKRPSPTQPED